MSYIIGFCFLVAMFFFGFKLISAGLSAISEGGCLGWLLGIFFVLVGFGLFPTGMGAPILILGAAFLCALTLFKDDKNNKG